jgi:hypothetical protein
MSARRPNRLPGQGAPQQATRPSCDVAQNRSRIDAISEKRSAAIAGGGVAGVSGAQTIAPSALRPQPLGQPGAKPTVGPAKCVARPLSSRQSTAPVRVVTQTSQELAATRAAPAGRRSDLRPHSTSVPSAATA